MKPNFFRDVDLIELSPLHRLLFAGLWCWADREGRLKDNPKQIKFDILPNDPCDCSQLLADLAERKFITRYEFNGNRYLEVTNFKVHQNPHKNEVASEIPGPLANTRDITGACRPMDEAILLIPDSLNLIPDSGFPQPAIADSPAASQEELNEQPLEFRDMLHRYVRRKGLKKPTKPILDRAELTWQDTAVGDAACDAALDGFHENEWWKTAKEPLLGFVKDPRSWMPSSWNPSEPQRVPESKSEAHPPGLEPAAPALVTRDFLAEWNLAVPEAFTERKLERYHATALLEMDEEFIAKFEEICEVARKVRKARPDSTWLTFYHLLATKEGEVRPNWTRVLTTNRWMAGPTSPESGQTDDEVAYQRWAKGGVKTENVGQRLAFARRYAAEMMASEDVEA